MPKRLVEFTVADEPDQPTILVEVEVSDETEGGLVRAARPGELFTKAAMSFGDAIDRLRPAAETIISRLRQLSHKPDEIEVEFGVKLSAEAGALIAAAGTEANCTVRLRWAERGSAAAGAAAPGAATENAKNP